MKVIITQKKLSAQVLAESPAVAVDLMCEQAEFQGWRILRAEAVRASVEKAVEQTMEFVQASGTYVLGSERVAQLQAAGTEIAVWLVSIDAEWSIDFTKAGAKLPAQSTEHTDSPAYQHLNEPGWYWTDETGEEYGPYTSQTAALTDYQEHVKFLNDGKRPLSEAGAEPDIKPTIPALNDLPG